MLQTSRRHEHRKEDPAIADCVHPETDSYFYSVCVSKVRQEIAQWVLILVFFLSETMMGHFMYVFLTETDYLTSHRNNYLILFFFFKEETSIFTGG